MRDTSRLWKVEATLPSVMTLAGLVHAGCCAMPDICDELSVSHSAHTSRWLRRCAVASAAAASTCRSSAAAASRAWGEGSSGEPHPPLSAEPTEEPGLLGQRAVSARAQFVPTRTSVRMRTKLLAAITVSIITTIVVTACSSAATPTRMRHDERARGCRLWRVCASMTAATHAATNSMRGERSHATGSMLPSSPSGQSAGTSSGSATEVRAATAPNSAKTIPPMWRDLLRKKSCLGGGVGVEHRSAHAPPASATSTSSSDGSGCTNASHVHNVLERLVGEPCRPHGCVKSSIALPAGCVSGSLRT